MDQFNAIFEYLPAHSIAICKSHQQGVVRSQLRTHLDTKHQELVSNTRGAIISVVHQEVTLRAWAVAQEDIVYPSAVSQPLPHLPVFRNGLQCNECARIYRHIKGIQEHCRQEHGWRGEKRIKAGRPVHTQVMWKTNVTCQKYHNTSALGRLFEVGAAADTYPRALNAPL
jgi:uncharacterized C2H2 Zn-finger protein